MCAIVADCVGRWVPLGGWVVVAPADTTGGRRHGDDDDYGVLLVEYMY